MRAILIVVVCAVGCKDKDPRFEGPLRIALGACAGPTVKFVSGPRPLPFTAESEGTTAKPATKPEPTDANDARQAAIDQSRAAGLHGSSVITTETAVSSESNSGFGPPRRASAPPPGTGDGYL